MLIAEEVEGEAGADVAADGVSGRMRKHLAASTHEVTSRIDALEEKVGAMDSKLDAMPAKLLEAVACARTGE